MDQENSEVPESPYEENPGECEMLDNLFMYHPPFGTQVERYKYLRGTARVLARAIFSNCPASAERTLATRKLQEAIMWANASIACNEQNPDTYLPR